ncbi:hypothetical protein EIP86_002606 [Pleurotus ostreatoroseus]|nr:hypothetical protein EIP86_002606 [Pleurotus ostreatoroseus]
MARLRRDTQEVLSPTGTHHKPLRVVACGTLFMTHTLSVPTHPEPASVLRAHSITRTRGGSASTCLSILAQFQSVDAMLVAPLGGNEEGRIIIRDLEQERVSTRLCKIWENAGVPSAWVLHADDTDTRTVINNNPVPDITHEEFVSLMGPVLVPENYAYLGHSASSPPHTPPASGSGVTSIPRSSLQAQQPATPPVRLLSNSPAPLDWIHFEGRSVKTTLSNIMGLDGLARERKWRSHCVFSLDVGRRPRQGVEALIPHADIIFLNRHYARAHSPEYASSPRAFLLSFTSIAAPHALLVAHWGAEGAAVLSIPTKEYFQSSGWVDPTTPPPGLSASTATAASTTTQAALSPERRAGEVQSVRSGSDFWASGHHTESSGEFSAAQLSSSPDPTSPVMPRAGTRLPAERIHTHRRTHRRDDSDSDSSDSDGTQIAGRVGMGARGGSSTTASALLNQPQTVDEVGAQDAFVAGMIYALSRRLVPGEPYTPSAVAREGAGGITVHGAEDNDRGKWRLEECLRFATELSGRKARKKGWDGLAEEMTRAGWFEP